jgi:hypothetical protein
VAFFDATDDLTETFIEEEAPGAGVVMVAELPLVSELAASCQRNKTHAHRGINTLGVVLTERCGYFNSVLGAPYLTASCMVSGSCGRSSALYRSP